MVKAQHTAAQLNLRDRRVTVLGLGREGTALVRFLVAQGAHVLATDQKPAAALARFMQELEGLPVQLELGGHPASVLDCDLLFVSPGVPLDAPILLQARQRRVLMSSETRLFCRLCPAPLVGITGSSGKTTTATLVARMAEASGRRTHLGGNIGSALLGRLADIAAGDLVVMELSSFQLDFFGPELHAEPGGQWVSPLFPADGCSPAVAAVLNITPNHLDRHPTFASYAAAKRKILLYQRPSDAAVLNEDDPLTPALAHDVRGRLATFSLSKTMPEGACLRGDELVLRRAGTDQPLCRVDQLRLRGQHNVANVLAACAVAAEVGLPRECMVEVARTFQGVEHRLEAVRELRGAWYYNDSIATSPERAIAAMLSFEEPIVLLAGGRDKHLPWERWADVVGQRVREVITFGEASELISDAVRRLGTQAPPVKRVSTVAEAVHQAARDAGAGDVVLFSPGGTSFDAYQDYAERGRAFKELVAALGESQVQPLPDPAEVTHAR